MALSFYACRCCCSCETAQAPSARHAAIRIAKLLLDRILQPLVHLAQLFTKLLCSGADFAGGLLSANSIQRTES